MKKIICMICILILLSGCSKQTDTVRKDLFAMDTLMSFHIYSADTAACDTCIDIVQALEAELAVTDPDSSLYAINQTGSGTLSQTAAVLLSRTLELSERTHGALDPTIYPLVQLWGFPDKAYQVPSADAIAALKPHIGQQHVHLAGTTVTLDGQTQLDLGAVTKGYAGQLCAEYLTRAGLVGSINLGGNVQTVGTKPDNTPWQIGIADPENTALPIAVLQLTGTNTIVTAGDYQRYFTEGNQTYHHILDPATGAPANSGLRSVTVVAQDGLLADGLSTALFVMGMEQATALWQQSADFEAVFVDRQRQIFVTEGLADQITNCAFTVITR